MLKREFTVLSAAAAADGPRSKKRKDEDPSSADVAMSDSVSEALQGGQDENILKEKDQANSQGLVLWQTVKDAVNKEDRILSTDFMQRPSKRQYADYYQQIQRPIFLEEIKKKLDANGYPSFEAVRQDLELCFSNAKAYNQKESRIWKDAKHLHKLVLREYARIAPSEEERVDIDGDVAEDDGADDKRKAKLPHMNRMLKSRLTKLVEKTDDTGRVMSEIFMELPSKREWPIYYKQIKRPQCLENIFKRLKRKEYSTSADFAADVELVFSNAMQFNLEHSPIWEDAKDLRDYFRQLMSDLPPPFTLQEYSKPSKIKLKVPPAASVFSLANSSPKLPSSNALTSSGSLVLRVPTGSSTPHAPEAKAKTQATTALIAPVPPASSAVTAQPPPSSVPLALTRSAASATSKAVGAPAPAPMPAPPTLPVAPAAHTATTAVTASIPAQATPLQQTSASYLQHYPNASYSASNPALALAPKPTLVNPFLNRAAPAPSVTPPPVTQHPLQTVLLRIEPSGRPFRLHHVDGVKSWAVRLSQGENAMSISDVRFLSPEEGETSGEEEVDRKEEEEEGGEESHAEADMPLKNGRKKGKSRGRPRMKAKATSAEKNKGKEPVVKKTPNTPLTEDVQVKLNGTLVKLKEEAKEAWYFELSIGSHVVEVGLKGGMVWTVFAERTS